MKIRFGYVAISLSIDITSSSLVTYSYYCKIGQKLGLDKVKQITSKNIDALLEILKFNIKNDIHFYRMTSNLIPLATHDEVPYRGIDLFSKELSDVGDLIKNNNMRVDIHPDQFCVLNSIRLDVVKNTINILNFYDELLTTMGLNSVIVLHIGSKQDGKKESIKRFISAFQTLSKSLQKRIVLENDDKTFTVRNTLSLCEKLKIPMVLDYHHFRVNHSSEKIEDYIERIFATWEGRDVPPKIHFSSPKNKKEKRSHHDYIDVTTFLKFLDKISFIDRDFDVMIEAKAKDFAMFKLIRELKYQRDFNWIDATTFEVKTKK